jgi:hypothetical protein
MWIQLAQNKVQWRDIMNTVRTFVFKKVEKRLDPVSNHQLSK